MYIMYLFRIFHKAAISCSTIEIDAPLFICFNGFAISDFIENAGTAIPIPPRDF